MDDQAISQKNIDLKQLIAEELDQAKYNLGEVELLLEQSQVELSKLTQRNTSITGHLQKIQANIEQTAKQDIRMAYNAVLDAQQRLLVMRAQLEKLQGEQGHLSHNIQVLENIQRMVKDNSFDSGGKGKSNSAAILEMLIDAQESERQKLSRLMHDGPVQALSNFIVQADIANKYFDIDPSKAKEELINLKNSATGTFQNVRDFILDLRPMMLDDLGLLPTVKRYLDTYKAQTGIEVNYSVYGEERRFSSYLEVMIFRAIQELLRNAYHYNQDNLASLKVELQISLGENLIRIVVNDNGKGFHTGALPQDGDNGFKLIRDRVEMLGGIFEVKSSIGQGSQISLQVPSLGNNPQEQTFTSA